MALTDEAIDKIKQMILSGRVRPGEKLPREADLAAGRIVPASVVHDELCAALERIEIRRGQQRGTVAPR